MGNTVSRLKLLSRKMSAFLFMLCFISFNVKALDIKYSNHTPNGCHLPDKAIILSGSIVRGDDEKISSWIRQNTWYLIEKNPPFVLDVQGGSLSEALKIAETFEQLYASAWIPGECENSPDNVPPKCTGSCFALVVGAVNRLFSSDAIGLHRPVFNPSEFKNPDLNVAKKKHQHNFDSYINWLKTRHVTATLIEKIKSHSPNNIFWLGNQEANLLPDTSPEFTQLTFNKCQYEKDLLSRWLDANSSGKSDQAKILREQWDKQSKCLESIRMDARERWALP
jgi:hypothetical protein